MTGAFIDLRFFYISFMLDGLAPDLILAGVAYSFRTELAADSAMMLFGRTLFVLIRLLRIFLIHNIPPVLL
jgi:hypothetical protein